MGTTTSRLDSTRRKHRRKLPSLRSQRSAREIIKSDTSNTSTLNKSDPSTSSINYPPTPVNLVKHQVVLSDHVPPMSTLAAVISIPMRRSSWRKSINTTTTKNTNDNASVNSSSYFDEDDEAISSPRTSVGSEENNTSNNIFSKVEESFTTAEKKKPVTIKKKPPSFSSLKNNYKNDIVFESKYSSSNSINSTSPLLSEKSEDKTIPLKDPPRPFWTYNNGDEREYDR